ANVMSSHRVPVSAAAFGMSGRGATNAPRPTITAPSPTLSSHQKSRTLECYSLVIPSAAVPKVSSRPKGLQRIDARRSAGRQIAGEDRDGCEGDRYHEIGRGVMGR